MSFVGGSNGPANPTATVPYHCVCGTAVSLSLETGGQCESCGRYYSAETARLAASETVRLPIDLNQSIDLEKLQEGSSQPEPGSVTEVPRPSEETPSSSTLGVDPLIGSRFGHFQVVSRLGRGGMGDVYRALDESLQRFVALKVLRASADGNTPSAGASLRLLQEARAQARVNHPGVVHIYFVSQDPQSPFLAMELVPGTTLAEQLRTGPLSYARTIDVALQLSRALRQAARFDVVHGDIKPGNILMLPDGGVKLSDFGLARRLSAHGTGPSGPITGTPHYIAPEILDGKEANIRSDMYALGVMLFEMTFGRRPYTVDTGTLRDQIEAHKKAPVEFPEQWPIDLPEEWRNVLSKLLQKDPELRYRSHDELITDLEHLRPIDLPRAGRLARLLAWGVDVVLAIAAQLLLLSPFGVLAARGILVEGVLPALLITGSISAVVLGAAAAVQAYWKTSPGKSLFQLRIVDRHGLPPSRMMLALRVLFQLLPVWGTDVQTALSEVGVEPLGLIAATTTAAIVLTDCAFALVRRDGRSLHDLLLRTRVALDTRTDPNSDSTEQRF